jgi:1-deoxy-D-xylulose-5-phosphate synthase
MKAKYQSFRRAFDAMAKKLPFIGDGFFEIVVRLKRAVKAVFYIDNFFVDLGFEYVGPIDGHNIHALCRVLKDVKNLQRPVVIHAVTRKGKGYGFAEDDPGSYHGVGSFSVQNGFSKETSPQDDSFTDAFSNIIVKAARKDSRIACITAAMEKGTGLSAFKKAFPERFFDVGIAESHAVTFAAALSASGIKPVVAIYSTFIQRSIDQIIHDTALQNLPVIFALDRSGFVDGDGETHQGLFDIALFRMIPGMTVLAPESSQELSLMLDYALNLNGPACIRYPKALCKDADNFNETDSLKPLVKGQGTWLKKGASAKILLAYTGSLKQEALKAFEILQRDGIEIDIYNIRFLNPVDEDFLEMLLGSYELAVFAEEGIYKGGFSEYVLAFARVKKITAKLKVIAVKDTFAEKGRALGTREELLSRNGLDAKSISCLVKDSI